MANELQTMLRQSGALGANTSPAYRWLEQLAIAIDAGSTGQGLEQQLVESLHYAGIPVGSPLGQWALYISRAQLPITADSNARAESPLLRLALGAQYQKPPAGESRVLEILAYNGHHLPA